MAVIDLNNITYDIEDIISLYIVDEKYEKGLKSYNLKNSKKRRYRKLKNKRKNFYHKIYNPDEDRYDIWRNI